MDSPGRRQSTGFNARNSLRNSTRYSMQQNETADEYDLEAMGISDGFRPGNDGTAASRGHNRMSSRNSQNEQTPTRRSTPPPRPSSTTKPRFDSFALRHDGVTNPSAPVGPAAMASSSSAGLLTRSSSVSTESPFVRPESPYQGPSAPSHPYQMYPQDAARLARTASVATTSTYQPPSIREYTGPGGPTHPYGMYPQNTVPEAEESHTSPATMIPVGFPGRNNDYHRRLGPEGEEAADLIGPDGHTEQLPPYTQYPEEAFARKAAAAPPMIVTGAGGIGLATRNPEFASQEDLVNPFESPINRTPTSYSDAPASTVPTTLSEKPPEKKWKQLAKRKVCGIIPVWVFVILAALIMIFAIIVGVAVSIVKSKMRGGHPPPPPPPTVTSGNEYATTVTTTYDATGLATAPPGLPTIPTGLFWLNIGVAQTGSPDCISDTTQYSAWSCQIPPNMLRLKVSQDDEEEDPMKKNVISLFNAASTDDSSNPPQYFYGAQPPTFPSDHAMDLVNDANANKYGPAWFFQHQYNKLVILNPTALAAPSSSKIKREALASRQYPPPNSFENNPVRRGFSPDIGEKPWFCYWNETLLETFIYPNASTQPSTSSTSSMPTTVPASVTASGSYPSSTASYQKQLPVPYPKIVRVEERRVSANYIEPYCVQMLILNNGFAVPWQDTNGDTVKVTLNETVSAAISSGTTKRGDVLYGRDDSSQSACNCVWLAS